MSTLPGFQEGVQALRNTRAAPFAPPAPSPTDDPYSYEAVVKEGSRKEREALAGPASSRTAFPHEPADLDNKIAQEHGSLRLPGWDRRLEQLGREVQVKKSAGGFLGNLKSVLTDLAGNPVGQALGKAVQALDVPAEGVERFIGMAYWNEVPLSDRWEMSRWTYDSIWADIFGGGGGGKSNAVQDYEAGKSWDEIEDEHDNALANTIAHFALDPLWLIGGVPLVGKLPGPVAKAAGAGLNFSKIPGLRAVPGIRRIGQMPSAQLLDEDVGILTDLGQASERFNVNRVNGGLRRFAQKNPQAHVDDAYTYITNTTSALSDPALWEEAAAGSSAVRLLFNDLATGSLSRQNMLGLEGTTPVKAMRRLFQENPTLNETLQRFESLSPMSGNAFWDDARHVLKTTHNGGPTTIPDLVRSGARRLTPEEYQRLGTYRSVKFMQEFQEKGLPALYDIYKLEKSDILQKAESLSGAMKSVLSLFTINTPGWAAMNFTSNAGAIMLKLDDPAGAANFLTHGLTSRRRAHLDSLGFGDDLTAELAHDSAMRKELAGGAEEYLSKGNSRGRRLLDRALPFLRMAEKFDQGGRVTAVEKGVLDASAAVWHSGSGGVLPPLTDLQKSVPGLEDFAFSLKFKGFGDIADYSRKLDARYSDELITADGLRYAWAKSAAPTRFPEAGGEEELARFIESAFPDHPLDQLDSFMDNARFLRRDGDPDYLRGLDDTIDDWQDDISLSIADRKLADGLPPDPLPYSKTRLHNVPWQDAAEFSRQQRVRQELYTRIVGANNPAFGGTDGAVRAQDHMRAAMARYNNGARELMKQAPRDLSAKGQRQLYADMGQLMETRNREISRVLADVPSVRKLWQNASRVEREHLNTARDLRISALDQMANMGEAERAVFWGQTLERAHAQDADSLARTWGRLGLEYAPRYADPSEYPVAAQGFAAMGEDVSSFLDFVRTELPTRFRAASNISDEQLTAARELIPHLETGMRQRNLVATHHARALRDSTMLNYAQKRGFDGMLALVFPYHFWIGRTAKDWMRLTAARPGQTAGLSALFQGVRDINEDADLPERLRANIRIPIPFLDEAVFGGAASMYFDPIRMIYPLSTFQSLDADGPKDSDAGTKAGKVFEFASNLGVGINPFMTLGLGSVGALGDRHAYVQRGLASVNSLPFGVPGPRVFRSASDWLAGVSQDPDPEYLTPEIKQLLAEGQPLPENVLKEAFQGIADLASTNGWEGYRTDRMVANLVGSDPERWSARDGLEALRYRRGSLWQEAVRLSKREQGLRVLTGWGLMPMAVYPEGEAVQRGLDAMWRDVRDTDDPKQVDAFFKQHPEYQVRRISLKDRDDPEGQLGELDTALFYLDLDKVEKKFGRPVDVIRDNIRRMEEAGYLETKEGRRLREVADNDVDQLTDLRQAELDQLDALYPHRKKELSLRAAPRERALYQLREQYYNIRRDQFKSVEEFYAARDAFVSQLPVEGVDPGEWMQAAVRSIAIWNQAQDEAGARPALASELIATRDQRLRQLTETNLARISREDFQRYLSQNGKPPTQNYLEYQKAKTEKDQYMAIGEASGLTEQTVKSYRRSFWQSHPLLDKYYGRDEPKAWNAESASTYGRMDEIWDGYYAVEGDARAERDYLGSQLEELNNLRRSVGLYPLRLLNFQPLEGGLFSRAPAPSEVLK